MSVYGYKHLTVGQKYQISTELVTGSCKPAVWVLETEFRSSARAVLNP